MYMKKRKSKIWDRCEAYLECLDPDERAEAYAKDYYGGEPDETILETIDS